MKEILNLENRKYLMGVSIFMIILSHAGIVGLREWNIDFCRGIFMNSYVGVDIFFLLSTYGLCYSYQKSSLKDFYVKRLKRLFPMYIVYFLMVVLIETYRQISCSEWIFQFIRQVTGIALLGGERTEWYVSALFLVYFSFPLMYLIVKWLHNRGGGVF